MLYYLYFQLSLSDLNVNLCRLSSIKVNDIRLNGNGLSVYFRFLLIIQNKNIILRVQGQESIKSQQLVTIIIFFAYKRHQYIALSAVSIRPKEINHSSQRENLLFKRKEKVFKIPAIKSRINYKNKIPELIINFYL